MWRNTICKLTQSLDFWFFILREVPSENYRNTICKLTQSLDFLFFILGEVPSENYRNMNEKDFKHFAPTFLFTKRDLAHLYNLKTVKTPMVECYYQ